MLYAQLLAFPALALAGWWIGKRSSLRPLWWMGVTLCLGLVGIVILGHRIPRLAPLAPFSWAVDGDINPFLMTPVVVLLFAILIPRIPTGRMRPAARVVMVAMSIYYGFLPPALALATQAVLADGKTRFDRNGICLQTTSYTCGPAAAVTCLRVLGHPADEATLAREAHTSPSFGTDARVLARTLERHYPGVHCEYRYVDSLENLPLPAIADCQIRGIGGHCVAVLAVEPDAVIVGDPLSGIRRLTRERFLTEWKGTAITFTGK